MYHFFVSREQVGESLIEIRGADVNHIKNVLRMKAGEKILLGDGEGNDYLCRIETFYSDAVTASILESGASGAELPAQIHLFQGLPKADKMELIIQKAVELGVFKVIPVNTERAVVKLDRKKEEARLKRWNAISESAAKQSKRAVIPSVEPVMSFREALLSVKDFDHRLIPYELSEGMDRTRELFRSVGPGSRTAVFIGPEGGFTEAEIALARENGVEPVTLGKRILRTETAGLAVLSVLMFQLESKGE